MKFICAFAIALPMLSGCTLTEAPPVVGTPLDSVLKEVQGGLQRAQDTLAASSLPQLQSVQLTLHTQVRKDTTGKITILVINVGGSQGVSASQDLVLTLIPPKPGAMRPLVAAPTTVADSIVELIKEAAQAAENARKPPFPLQAKTVTLEFAFTVTDSLDGGLKFNLGSVSADAGGSTKNGSQQKITITFAAPKLSTD